MHESHLSRTSPSHYISEPLVLIRVMTTSGQSPFRDLGDLVVYVTSSPVNTVAFLLLLPMLTLGLSYLTTYMISPLNKFPGPPLACKSRRNISHLWCS